MSRDFWMGVIVGIGAAAGLTALVLGYLLHRSASEPLPDDYLKTEFGP